MEFYSAVKKYGATSFEEKWVELEIIMFHEISHSHKNKYCMISLTCGI
jgi:hypothetical protein